MTVEELFVVNHSAYNMVSQIKLHVYLGASPEQEKGSSELAMDCCGVNQPLVRKDEIIKALSEEAALHVDIVKVPPPKTNKLDLARYVHDGGFIDFLESVWDRWAAHPNRDPDFFAEGRGTVDTNEPPAMVPGNGAQRDASARPGQSVTSQCSYYVTDRCAPIFSTLLPALAADAAVVRAVLDAFPKEKDSNYASYALTTHPGHHAAKSSASGYCYVNSAAVIADALRRERSWVQKVAVIDIDYHAGNGTIGIFWDVPEVFVCSIHADPDIEYPYNSGFADQVGGTGNPAAVGTTLCLPLGPGATWTNEPCDDYVNYRSALLKAIAAVRQHGADALVVSLGVDTLVRDPVAVPGAGFCLELDHYTHIGSTLRECGLPAVFVQEGGYDMSRLGCAVTNTLRGFCVGQIDK